MNVEVFSRIQWAKSDLKLIVGRLGIRWASKGIRRASRKGSEIVGQEWVVEDTTSLLQRINISFCSEAGNWVLAAA